MYIYKVNEDGVTCAQEWYDDAQEIPEGWTVVPKAFAGKKLFNDGGKLTNTKPQAIKDIRQAELLAEIKIQRRIRELAIADLKATGDLPQDYVDTLEDNHG